MYLNLSSSNLIKKLQKEYASLILKVDSEMYSNLDIDDDSYFPAGYYLNGNSLLEFAINLTKEKKIEETLNVLKLADKIINNKIFSDLFNSIYLKTSEILKIAEPESKFLNHFLTLVLTGKHIDSITDSKSTLTYFIYLFIYGKIEISPVKPQNHYEYYEYVIFDNMAPYYIIFV